MYIEDFKIPSKIIELIKQGFWPSSLEEASRQNTHSLVRSELIKNIAPDEKISFFTILIRLLSFQMSSLLIMIFGLIKEQLIR